MEIVFSFFKILSTIIIEGLYSKSLVNHLFSFDLNKNIILIKNNKLKKYNKPETAKLYNPEKIILKQEINNLNNNKDSNNNKDIYNNYIDDIKKKPITISRAKTEYLIENNKKTNDKKYIKSFVKMDNSYTFDKYKNNRQIINLHKQPNYINEKSHNNRPNFVGDKDYSQRCFFNSNNIENKIEDIQEKYKKVFENEKKCEGKNSNNIIKKIKFNSITVCFSYYFYCKRKKYLENILIDEGMKLVVEILDIQYLFRKLNKNDITQENDNQLIEMSDDCKLYLSHIKIK